MENLQLVLNLTKKVYGHFDQVVFSNGVNTITANVELTSTTVVSINGAFQTLIHEGILFVYVDPNNQPLILINESQVKLSRLKFRNIKPAT